MTAIELSQLPQQIAEAVTGIDAALHEADARSHRARLLRNLRSALLPLAGRLAVALAKAQSSPPHFDARPLLSSLVAAAAALEETITREGLTPAQARRIIDVKDRLDQAAAIARRLTNDAI